jgi:predicted ATP-dependent serine protease
LFQVCEREILETGAKLLVIDSWGRFTGITEQEENKTAPVQERITELRTIVTNTGATVLILHHVRKNGGGTIEAGLGSSALAQQVDVLLSLSGEPAQEDVSPGNSMVQSAG